VAICGIVTPFFWFATEWVAPCGWHRRTSIIMSDAMSGRQIYPTTLSRLGTVLIFVMFAIRRPLQRKE